MISITAMILLSNRFDDFSKQSNVVLFVPLLLFNKGISKHGSLYSTGRDTSRLSSNCIWAGIILQSITPHKISDKSVYCKSSFDIVWFRIYSSACIISHVQRQAHFARVIT